MAFFKYLKNGLIGAVALILVGTRFVPGAEAHSPVLFGPAALVAETRSAVAADDKTTSAFLAKTTAALGAFATAVRPLSHPKALEFAFRSYFAYLAENTYQFTGHTGGRAYSAMGLRLKGVSGNFNGNALARGVVAHGAPYVTADRAGRSEGCPAMEEDRARHVLPKLADGGMVFLFAPDQEWMADDPWVVARGE